MTEVVQLKRQQTVNYVRLSDGVVVGTAGGPQESALFQSSKYPRPPRTLKIYGPNGWLYPKPYQMDEYLRRWPWGHYKWKADFNLAIDATETANQDAHVVERLNRPSDPIDPALTQRAEIKALTALKNQRVNFGIALATAQQTADLAGSTAARLANAYRAMRKGDFKKLRRYLSTKPGHITQDWLEYQYAWKPLLNDVYGASKELEGMQPRHWVVTAKGNASKKTNFEEVVNAGYNGNVTGGIYRRRGVQAHRVRLDCIPGNEMLALASRLGLTNPLEVLWDVLPYSFIVDWFYPLGESLGALDAAFGYEFLSGTHSVLRKHSGTFMTGGPIDPSIALVRDASDGVMRWVALDRSVYGGFPTVKPPRLKSPLSLGHMANGLALLAEAFGR